MNYSDRKIAIIYNELFPRKIEVDIKTIHQCIEEEMKKSEDLIDESFIDFCINLINEVNMGSNNIITEDDKKDSFKKILDIINSLENTKN